MSRSAKVCVIGAAVVASAIAIGATLSLAQTAAPKKAAPAVAQTNATPGLSVPGLPGKFGIGTVATSEQIAGWDIDVRPDGQGLPPGKGTAKEGETIFTERCSSCHGDFGEGRDRWPVLAGGIGTLKHERPEKTIGSFWPSVSTVFDYVRRAMPYGNAQSLTHDELYAVVAYILQMNDVVKDPEFVLSDTTYASIKLPNADGFYDDDRETTEKHFWNKKVCMANCGVATTVTSRAMTLDVTPDKKDGPRVD
jgi:cytochrome c